MYVFEVPLPLKEPSSLLASSIWLVNRLQDVPVLVAK